MISRARSVTFAFAGTSSVGSSLDQRSREFCRPLERHRNGRRRNAIRPLFVRVRTGKPFERGRAQAISQIEIGADGRVLILGSGTGSVLEYLPPEATITAVDITPAMVERTAARAESLDRAVDTHVGDAHDLPFEDDVFDVVLLHLVLSVVPDPHAVVAETERVLAPDGRVSVFDKFVPAGTTPSLPRRVANPIARVLFSDLTRKLEPMLSETTLDVKDREWLLGDLYTVAVLHSTTETSKK